MKCFTKESGELALKGCKLYLKKPFPIKARQINQEFSVQTKEGTMKGKIGDYLLQGIKGELYPCDKEIFETSYEEAI